MAIPISETLLTMAQAARESRPLNAKPASPQTIWRWHQKGIYGVKLETVLIGGQRHTSREALQRFANAVTEARDKGLSQARLNEGGRSEQTAKALQTAGLA